MQPGWKCQQWLGLSVIGFACLLMCFLVIFPPTVYITCVFPKKKNVRNLQTNKPTLFAYKTRPSWDSGWKTDRLSLRDGSPGVSSLHLSVRLPRGLACSYQAIGWTGRRPAAGEPALAGIARCQAHLSNQAGVTDALDHMELAMPCAHTNVPSQPPSPNLPLLPG